MRFLSIVAVATCTLASGCAAPPAQQPIASEPSDQPINTALTCAQFLEKLHADDKRAAGSAITWLKGYYSGRANVSAIPAGWVKTVSQGVGGTCAISPNASRTVLDVIAQLHRDYGRAAGVR
jgi:hypothetical protein